jgi:hypothetical protein
LGDDTDHLEVVWDVHFVIGADLRRKDLPTTVKRRELFWLEVVTPIYGNVVRIVSESCHDIYSACPRFFLHAADESMSLILNEMIKDERVHYEAVLYQE